jgi:hypothetical protein
MVRLLLRLAVFVGSAAIGILAAALLLPEVSISVSGFLLVVLLFALAQSALTPYITRTAQKNAPAFLGGTGLVSTFVALLIASAFGTLTITGWQTWILATLVVWLVTVIATLLLSRVALGKKPPANRPEPNGRKRR